MPQKTVRYIRLQSQNCIYNFVNSIITLRDKIFKALCELKFPLEIQFSNNEIRDNLLNI